jgi:lipopolysaccharide transport system ATP-binding protein
MSNSVIKVEHLSKQYRIGAREGYKTFRETLVDAAKAPLQGLSKVFNRRSAVGGRSSGDDTIWALKDVSFEVKQGEVIGVIGRNGAGKSTLLKILSRITEPTEGRVELRGRVGSLLEVGTGFHPELTGHENIYLYGAILGMDRWEITRKFDEIVAFAELEKFIDTPVKKYSSGMYMRLAFSVAAHLEPEILLVDEVLAVGDAAFQKKCLGKMGDVATGGRTVLFVSHNMTAVGSLCGRTLLLSEGKKLEDGNSKSVIHRYIESNYDSSLRESVERRSDRGGDGSIKVVEIRLGTPSNPICGFWVTGEDAIADLTYQCSADRIYPNVEVALGIYRTDQSPLLYLGTKVIRREPESVRGRGVFRCQINRLPLEPGKYALTTEIKQKGVIVDLVDTAVCIEVAEGDYYGTGVLWPFGGFLCDYTWSLLAPAQSPQAFGTLASATDSVETGKSG